MKFIKYFLLLLSIGVFSCVDQDFDEPPTNGEDPTITANAKISDLMGLFSIDQVNEVTEDWIIKVTVVADDRSGNYFETLIVEDETGGIALLLNESDLFNRFPVGRRLFISCKGLNVADFAGLPQLGGSPRDGGGVNKIEPGVIDDFITPGEYNIPVEPELVTISQLNSSMLNRLIKIENVEFSNGSVGRDYANADEQRAVNHDLKDCSNAEIIVRTSGYCDFASESVPSGNGSIIAIYSVFRSDNQLILRDLEDVNLNGERCDGGGGGGGGNGDEVTISSVRDAFDNNETTAPNGFITGIVISDASNGNIHSQNVVVQNGEAGIVVRFDENHSFSLGDAVEIDISGQTLSEFNGLLQVGSTLNNASKTGTGNISPRETTIDQVRNNEKAWESTLVTIKDAEISGGATFSGSHTVADATAEIDMFTGSRANFSGEEVPSDKVELTAIVSNHNGVQLSLRSRMDVTGGTTGGGGGGGDNDMEVVIGDLRTAYANGSTTAPNGFVIGVVISDVAHGNTNNRNVVIQNGDFGIVVRFTESHSFALGESIKVIVGEQTLSDYNGLVQLNNVPITNAESLGDGVLPTPRVATIQEIKANASSWESTVVSISGVTLSGASTFGGGMNGNLTVKDATGEFLMHSSSAASFYESAIPSGEITLTAVVSTFNDVQVFIRNMNDIN